MRPTGMGSYCMSPEWPAVMAKMQGEQRLLQEYKSIEVTLERGRGLVIAVMQRRMGLLSVADQEPPAQASFERGPVGTMTGPFLLATQPRTSSPKRSSLVTARLSS